MRHLVELFFTATSLMEIFLNCFLLHFLGAWRMVHRVRRSHATVFCAGKQMRQNSDQPDPESGKTDRGAFSIESFAKWRTPQ